MMEGDYPNKTAMLAATAAAFTEKNGAIVENLKLLPKNERAEALKEWFADVFKRGNAYDGIIYTPPVYAD